MTVPHQSFDNVRLLVGNLHMHGGLVSAGRIELVGLAGSAILVGCLNRGLSRLGGVFGSQIRSEMLLAMRILRGFENDLLVHLLEIVARHCKITHMRYSTPKNGRTFFNASTNACASSTEL